MTHITLANKAAHFEQIEALASIIWHEHYLPIIGLEQVEYMLEKYQSTNAMAAQIEEGFQYFMMFYMNSLVGYMCIGKKADTLFLSKIYISKNYRGKKIGKTAMQFIEDRAKDMQCKTITLTVNRHNTGAIAAYKKLSFKNLGAVVVDIGNGFVMDDYKLEKRIL